MHQNENNYQTQSLALAATLICHGFPLKSAIQVNPGKFVFVFLANKDLEQVLNKFWEKNLTVEPTAFWEAQRFLKSRIYDN